MSLRKSPLNLLCGSLTVMLSLALSGCVPHQRGESIDGHDAAGQGSAMQARAPDRLVLTEGARPASVQGCSCLVAANAERFQAAQFLFAEKYAATNVGDHAFVFINGEPLRLTPTIPRSSVGESGRELKYQGQRHRVKVVLTPETTGQRPALTGTLRWTYQDAEPISRQVYGRCGC